MTGKKLSLTVRKITYSGHAISVDQVLGLLQFKLHPPSTGKRPCFLVGDLAILQSTETTRCRWLGEIISINNGKDPLWPSLYTTLHIRIPPAGELLESLENVAVKMQPVANLKPSREVVKLGIIGFGKIERFLVEMALQSIDVELVAIHAPPMSPESMAEEWKSSNVSVSVSGPETLMFTRRYYERQTMDNRVDLLLEDREVAVLREPDKFPWEQANVDFVMECSTLLNEDKDAQLNDHSQVNSMTEVSSKNRMTKDSNSSLRCLPKVLDSFGVYEDGIMRTKFHDHETEVRAAQFNIITSSPAAASAVCHEEIFPDWNKDPTSISFLATSAPAALHRSDVVNTRNVNLQVTLVNAENCSGIDRITTRFCDADNEVHRRLKAIMNWCLDIIRCVPVGKCYLKLA